MKPMDFIIVGARKKGHLLLQRHVNVGMVAQVLE